MTTAIIGTGSIGSTLATLLAHDGEDLVLASRTPESARAVAQRTGVRAAPVEEAFSAADVVILAVWLDVARELLATHRDALGGKVVVDPSNPVAFGDDGGFVRTIGEDESAGTILAAAAPDSAAVVKAFGGMAAQTLADSSGLTPAVAQFYTSEDEGSDATATRLIRAAGYVPVRVGSIDRSNRLEIFGDLHELTLGKTLTEDEARQLI